MGDSDISRLAGGVLGVAVGFIAAFSMAVGRGEWHRLVSRLVGGAVGGALGGVVGALLQFVVLPQPYAVFSFLNFGTIFLVASVGSILGLFIANRFF
jgi:hypothetical protein